jgi:aspartate kinase
MIVMKFGGSSVDSAESIGRVAGIVRTAQAQPAHDQPVIVVSAMAKTTRQLLACADAAAAGDPAADAIFEELCSYHRREALAAVDPAGRPALEARLDRFFGELRDGIDRIRLAGCVTPCAADEIASFGELLSSTILAQALDGAWIDCRRVLVTDDSFTRARPIYEETEPRLRDALLPHVRAGRVPVVGGYVGATREGITTTLGKEGSDFSAAIVGAALGAEEVQIWTDVDGMMTADPRLVPSARRIRTLSFGEALELACSGAKKPHYGTIDPAKRADVPIRILNSYGASEGTLIGRRGQGAPPGVKSIAWRANAHLLRARASAGREPDEDILPRVCEVCERFRPSLIVVRVGERDIDLALDRVDRLPEIRAALEPFAEVEIEPGRAVVSLVSDDLGTSDDLAATVLEMASAHDPRRIVDGVAAPCIRCLVDEAHAERIVAELHERVFPGPPGEPIE